MKRKCWILLATSLVVLVIGAGAVLSQDTPELPEPPAAALAPLPPEPPLAQTFLLGDNGDNNVWLGVALSDISADKARELKLPGEYGVLVNEVEDDSPAAKAGLAKNDVIVEFAGERVRSVAQFQRMVRETPGGRAVPLEVNRAGQTRTVNVKLESRDLLRAMKIRPPEIGNFNWDGKGFVYRTKGPGASLGISGDDLTKQLADYFGVKQGKGVLVREVVVGSAAEKAGLRAGDVITKVDSHDVDSVAAMRHALPHDLEEKRKVTLTIVRDRHEQTLTAELEPTNQYRLRRTERLDSPAVPERWITEYIEAQKQARALLEQTRQAAATTQKQLRREMLDEARRLREAWQRHGDEYKRLLQDELGRYKQLLRERAGAERVV